MDKQSTVVVKIGTKRFLNYYLPIADFLTNGSKVQITALGKNTEMALYIASTIQSQGAVLENIKIGQVVLPAQNAKNNKPVNIVLLTIDIKPEKFKCPMRLKSGTKN